MPRCNILLHVLVVFGLNATLIFSLIIIIIIIIIIIMDSSMFYVWVKSSTNWLCSERTCEADDFSVGSISMTGD